MPPLSWLTAVRRLRRMLLLGALPVCFSTAASASDIEYIVREVISVRPGEQQTREFLVDERFSLARPGPVEAYLVYSWGITVTAGELEIKLSVAPEAQPGWVVFAMIAVGYSLDLGPVVRFFRATSPATLTGTVPIASTFGIYYIGTAVIGCSSARLFPIPFSITFSVSEQEPAEEPA